MHIHIHSSDIYVLISLHGASALKSVLKSGDSERTGLFYSPLKIGDLSFKLPILRALIAKFLTARLYRRGFNPLVQSNTLKNRKLYGQYAG